MLAGGAAQPAARGRDDPPPRRPGRVRARADVPGHRAGPRARRGAVERRVDRAAAAADDPGPVARSRSSARSSSPTRACSSTSATCSCRRPGSGSTARGRACTCARSASTRPPPTRRASTSTDRATPTSSSAACWPAWPARRSRWRSRPGWFGDQTIGGRGWIAVGLVIFAQWSPIRAAIGAYLFGAIFRFMLDIQGVDDDPRASRTRSRPAARRRSSWRCCRTLFVIVVVDRSARARRCGGASARRRRWGSPYVRGERSGDADGSTARDGRSATPRRSVSRPSSSIWT